MRTSQDALRSLRYFVWKALESDAPQVWRGESRDWEIRLWGTEGEFAFPFARVAAITPTDYSGSAFVREAARTFAVHAYPVPMATPEDSIIEVERVEELLFQAFERGISYTEPLMGPLVLALNVIGAGTLAADSYTYLVTSVNGTGESVPYAPLVVGVGDGSSVRIDWSPAVDADTYNLYRVGSDEIAMLVASDIAALTYLDTGEAVGPQDPPADSGALARVETGPWRIPLYDFDGVPLDGTESITYRRFPNDFLRVKQAPVNRMTDPEDDKYWLITVEPRLTWRRTGRSIPGAKTLREVRMTENPS